MVARLVIDYTGSINQGLIKMVACKYLKEFEKKTGLKLGHVISGAHGLIYKLQDYPNRVVKINQCYCYQSTLDSIRSLKNIKRAPTVRVYQYGELSDNHYYYVMDKLKKINTSASWAQEMYHYEDGCEQYLYYDCNLKLVPSKVKTFFSAARQLHDNYGMYHTDTHPWNIMQTSRGALKFIDLESF